MFNSIYSSPWLIQRLHRNLLGTHIERLAALLLEQGYPKDSTEHKLALVAAFGRWLEARRCKFTALNAEKIDAFLRARKRHRVILRGDRNTLLQLLAQMHARGDVPPPAAQAPSPLERALQEYTDYLVQERGLAHWTVSQYQRDVRRFLIERFGGGSIRLDTLCQTDTHRHLQRRSRVVCANTLHGLIAALRVYLTFLHLRGDLHTNLAAGIPAVACWRLSTVPKYLKPAEVEQLLNSCDQSTIKGQRDYTILLLLARLGLRAGELTAMRLDDLHWDSGEMLVRGKGQRHDRLPIPREVGKALATYLRKGRPRSQSRHVFLRINAPHREFASSSDISTIVRQAVDRAGLHPPCKGAHVLRHSLATHMLQKGATMTEIGEVLRHRNPISTECYAKVDLRALSALAQSWPEERL
jgi:site-specific recombinase XerD